MIAAKSIWLSTLLGLLFNCTVSADTRNCSADEKIYADNILLALAGDVNSQKDLVDEHLPFGVPIRKSEAENEFLLYQGGYVSSYDDDLKTTLWTAYRLTSKDMFESKDRDRVNCFRPDPRFSNAPVNDDDYDEPVFDRGHMTNDASLKDELSEQLNTYVYTNMSPQFCETNRGIWLTLEDLERDFASLYTEVFVINGAIFDRDGDGLRDSDRDAVRVKSNDGSNRVAVPTDYYKLLLRRDGNLWWSISFLISNSDAKLGGRKNEILPDVLSSIASLEKVEGQSGLILTPSSDRRLIQQSVSGEGWDMTLVSGNMERTCN